MSIIINDSNFTWTVSVFRIKQTLFLLLKLSDETYSEKFEDANEKISCKSKDWQYNAQKKEEKINTDKQVL